MDFSDETEDDLRTLIERDFGPIARDCLTHLTVIDWLHYRARLIPERWRRVVLSPPVLAQLSVYPAIHMIRNALERGGDVSPWLSKRIRQQPSNSTADLMFNDWQISHFHLGGILQHRNKVKRTRDLLFVLVKADHAVLIDVKPHGSWAMRSLLETLYSVSPADLSEMKGIIGTVNPTLTDQQLHNLRQNGFNSPIQIGGGVFLPPGLGLVSSRHAIRLARHADAFTLEVARIKNELSGNKLPQTIQLQLAGTIGMPIRLGIRFEAGCLLIYEKTRGLVFSAMRPVE